MPMAPAPITITLSGTVSMTMASRYWITRSPSIFVPGRLRADAPTAMMKLAAVTVRGAASAESGPKGVTWRVWASVKPPCPLITSILFFFIKKPTPFT